MLIRSFESLEEMIEAMEDDSIEANSAVKEWQSELSPGDYFVRVGMGVPIFCEVLDPAVPQFGDVSEEDLEELKQEAEWYKEPHMLNFRFCRAYSIYCPEGELGDVHISTAALKISKEHFESARNNNWNPRKE